MISYFHLIPSCCVSLEEKIDTSTMDEVLKNMNTAPTYEEKQILSEHLPAPGEVLKHS